MDMQLGSSFSYHKYCWNQHPCIYTFVNWYFSFYGMYSPKWDCQVKVIDISVFNRHCQIIFPKDGGNLYSFQ